MNVSNPSCLTVGLGWKQEYSGPWGGAEVGSGPGDGSTGQSQSHFALCCWRSPRQDGSGGGRGYFHCQNGTDQLRQVSFLHLFKLCCVFVFHASASICPSHCLKCNISETTWENFYQIWHKQPLGLKDELVNMITQERLEGFSSN